jgi:hypothetical protein
MPKKYTFTVLCNGIMICLAYHVMYLLIVPLDSLLGVLTQQYKIYACIAGTHCMPVKT